MISKKEMVGRIATASTSEVGKDAVFIFTCKSNTSILYYISFRIFAFHMSFALHTSYRWNRSK